MCKSVDGRPHFLFHHENVSAVRYAVASSILDNCQNFLAFTNGLLVKSHSHAFSDILLAHIDLFVYRWKCIQVKSAHCPMHMAIVADALQGRNPLKIIIIMIPYETFVVVVGAKLNEFIGVAILHEYILIIFLGTSACSHKWFMVMGEHFAAVERAHLIHMENI